MKIYLVKAFLFTWFVLSACTQKPTKTKFLSVIHSDLESVCRFTPELKKVEKNPEEIGPLLKPLIRSWEMRTILKTLEGPGGDDLKLLAAAFGYEKCDLIQALSTNP